MGNTLVRLILLALSCSLVHAGTSFILQDWCISSNTALIGCNGGPPMASNVDAAGFDFESPNSLGDIMVSLGPNVGPQSVFFYFDYDISIGSLNEFASVTGAKPANLYYQLGDPAFALFTDFQTETLNGTNSVSVAVRNVCCDVAMAIGMRDLLIGAGETGTVTMRVAETAPTTGLYITQTQADGASPATLYYSLSFTTSDSVPEPSTSALLVIGAVALAGLRIPRRRSGAFSYKSGSSSYRSSLIG